MVLKSYRIFKPGKKRKKNRSGARDILAGGITALIGIGLLSETASAVRRI